MTNDVEDDGMATLINMFGDQLMALINLYECMVDMYDIPDTVEGARA